MPGLKDESGVGEVTSRPLFVYFAHGTLQIPRVARQCMVGLCEGAAALGAEAEIVGPKVRIDRSEPVHADFADLYGVEWPVRYRPLRLPWVHANREGRFSALVRLLVYGCFVSKQILSGRWRGRLVILSARNASVLWLLALFKRLFRAPVVVLADIHGPLAGRMMRMAVRRVDGAVCISQALTECIRSVGVLPAERIVTAHSGVKPDRFQQAEPLPECETHKSTARCLLVYAGKVYYRYEEVAYLMDVAEQVQDFADIWIVGGRPDQIPPWREELAARQLHNVRMVGFVEPAIIPRYLACADILVMYYSPSALNAYRSPGKLFEYLATGKPLVAAKFEAVAEVIEDGVNGFLVPPYEPTLLADRIRNIWQDRERLNVIGEAAQATALRYTWQDRAEILLQSAQQWAAVKPRERR